MALTTDNRFPYRVVDARNQGWHPTGSRGEEPRYVAYTGLQGGGFLESGWDELAATRGPLRPVEPVTDDDEEELFLLFRKAGRKTITTLAAALETVFHETREAHGGLSNNAASSYAWARRTLVAGRPGSWESELLIEVVLFGNELNLAKPGKGLADGDVDARRKAGPGKRVDVAARSGMAAIIDRWVSDPARFTEVAETLAGIVSAYCDQTAGLDGWRAVADQWLQPDSLARDSFSICYRLFYSVSGHFDSGLI